MMEDAIKEEKKRHKQEFRNLKTALEENQKMENLQESVDFLEVHYLIPQ